MRCRAALVVVAALVLGGCAGSGGGGSIADAAAKGGAGYVAGDGTIEKIAVVNRRTDIRVQGTTLEGAPLDTATYRGKVVVINTWGSWCPPCNAEAPALQRTWESVRARGVQFVGIDLRESAATGRAFQRKYGVTYPSLTDGTSIQPQLKGKAAATPTTLLLDRQGRLAARVSGQVDESTLRALLDEVLQEPA